MRVLSVVSARRAGAVLATVAVTVGVLTGGALTGPAAGAATTRPGIRLALTSGHHVVAPASTTPGLVHVLNTGGHDIIFVRRASKGVDAFVKDLNAGGTESGAIRFYKDFPLVDWVWPHANEYVRLTKGTYYLADPAQDHATAGQVHVLTVTGRTVDAPAPGRTVVQAAANGHVTSRVTLARQSFAHVVNRTSTPQIISIGSIRKGVTNAQVRAVLNDPKRHSYKKIVGSYFLPLGQLAAHTDLYRLVPAKPARYLLFAASLTHPGLAKGQIGLLTVR